MFALLGTRRFGPLFATQFGGAFNDNLFKTAMLIEISYRLYAGDAQAGAAVVTAAAGIFILPFFLFSGLSGRLSDRIDKARVMRWVKLAEVVILGFGGLALWLGSVPMLFVVLFGMGCHSTVFGPVKYAILPQHLRPRELLEGTGLVEGGTFVAILLGQMAGGLLPTGWAAAVMLAVAVAGVAASGAIPAAPPALAGQRLDWNPWTTSRAVLAEALAHPKLVRATVAISWFWAVGTVYTAEFVPLVKGRLAAPPSVATLFLLTFTIGIAAGSLAAPRLLRGQVSGRAAPWAALAMAAAGLDLMLTINALPAGAPIDGIAAFVGRPAHWHLLADLFALAAAGGVFSVPLYGVLQTAGSAGSRSSTVAANNIVNAGAQVAAALLAGVAVGRGAPIAAVLAVASATGVLLWPLLRRIDAGGEATDTVAPAPEEMR